MKHHCEKMETGEHLCFILKWLILDTSGLGRSGGKRHWTNHKEAGGHQVFTLLLLQFLIVIVIVYIRTSGIYIVIVAMFYGYYLYQDIRYLHKIVAIVSSLLLLFTSGWWSQESQRGFWTQTPTSPGLLISTLSSRYRQLCNFYSQQSQHSMC